MNNHGTGARMMSETRTYNELVADLEVRLLAGYGRWQRGESADAGPSSEDHVRDACDMLGLTVTDETAERLAEAVYEMECQGATMEQVATLLVPEVIAAGSRTEPTTEEQRERAEARERLTKALERFQNAAEDLLVHWYLGDEAVVSEYPGYLPSFEEFVHDVMGMRVVAA